MMLHDTYAWLPPLDALPPLSDEQYIVCLHSAFPEAHTGRYSFLCWGLKREISGNEWITLAPALSSTRPWYENAWFGWLGYDLRHANEILPHGSEPAIAHVPLCMMTFRHILRFSHETQHIDYYHDGPADLRWQTSSDIESPIPAISSLKSNMTKARYLKRVEETLKQIQKGAFYQANITRKFYGTFTAQPCAISLFTQLCHLSPAPYSALIKRKEDAVISSSPECFLSIDKTGVLTARPIKGSAPRVDNAAEDAKIRNILAESSKDLAENRMIVDLMRNDLSRVSIPGSVRVTEQARIHSYTTIHHLTATIKAQKRKNATTLDAVACCFPPGSMTGAPKIAAMKWCSAQEGIERGIYSGAIGWFAGDGSCDLSVVIRTLLVRGDRFEFQVGGGIVADSTPEQEWLETMTKARALCRLLAITSETMEAL